MLVYWIYAECQSGASGFVQYINWSSVKYVPLQFWKEVQDYLDFQRGFYYCMYIHVQSVSITAQSLVLTLVH